MFEQSIVISGKRGATKKPMTMVLSLALQVGIVVIAIIIPLIYYSVLPASAMTAFLAAPPPPPPPPPPAPPAPKIVVHRMVSQFINHELLAPKVIPKQIAVIKDTAPPPPQMAGVVGGVSGGSTGGVLGGIVSAAAPPPPPPPENTAPIRVGGDVEAANCISCPKPQYPPLAREARIQGAVVLEALISKTGTIENLHLISGHPMLVGAAMQAVRNWRYRPTVLDGQPTEVQTEITLNFTLAGG